VRSIYFTNPVTPAWGVGRIISRTNESRLFANVFNRFFLIEDVVTGSHHVDPGGKQLLAQLRRDGKSARKILCIHDREIDLVLLAQILDAFEHSYAPRLSDNISDDEDFHNVLLK
jgi:hypothetical protein